MKLSYKKGKGDKVHLHADGDYILTVDELFFSTLSIKQNQEVSADELNKISDLICERRAYNYALSLLSRRDHTAKELKAKLSQKGFQRYCEKVVEKLISQDFVNDERFAEHFVRELVNLKGYGKRRVEQELFRKGVEKEIISNVLDETEFEDEKLLGIIERKYLRHLDTEKGVRKTVNSLIRLGYSYSEIRDAIKTVLENNEFNFEVTDE